MGDEGWRQEIPTNRELSLSPNPDILISFLEESNETRKALKALTLRHLHEKVVNGENPLLKSSKYLHEC